MRRARLAPALVVGLLAPAACNAIFGIDPPEKAASSATSTSTSTSGAGGGGADDVVLIPAGTYAFVDQSAAMPVDATLTRDLEIDRFEVTVARFQAWLDAKSPAPCTSGTCDLDPSGPYSGALVWDATWNQYLGVTAYAGAACNPAYLSNLGPTYPSMRARVPITCVNWYQAAAFCRFENKRLLTETEWRFAATSRGKSVDYPWGSDPPGILCDHAIFSASQGANDCHFPVEVGSAKKGATEQGVFDLAGSAYEWGWDWQDYYPTSPTTDYTGGSGLPDDAGNVPGRVTLGGSFATTDSNLHVFDRNFTSPDSTFADIGFRCGRSK